MIAALANCAIGQCRPVQGDSRATDITSTTIKTAQDGRRRRTVPRSGRTGQDSTTEY